MHCHQSIHPAYSSTLSANCQEKERKRERPPYHLNIEVTNIKANQTMPPTTAAESTTCKWFSLCSWPYQLVTIAVACSSLRVLKQYPILGDVILPRVESWDCRCRRCRRSRHRRRTIISFSFFFLLSLKEGIGEGGENNNRFYKKKKKTKQS